ncbi:hypothetical protein RV02_GL002730 [Enterococcus gilvus]|nr:hypothetical protein RV02_GL002730 [Enterococcus gilvus]
MQQKEISIKIKWMNDWVSVIFIYSFSYFKQLETWKKTE